MTRDEPLTMDSNDGVYVISVAAELLGVHPQTLRGYERQGLLKPGRTKGGTRLYSPADISRARRVIELSDQGLTHAGISRILALEDRVARLTTPSVALVPLKRSSGPTGQGRDRGSLYRRRQDHRRP